MASMETTPSPAPGVASSPPPAPPGGSGPVGSAPTSTPEQRARWREKSKIAYQRRQARAKGLPDPFPDPVVVAQPSAGPVPAPAGDPPPVPWDPSVLDPLFRTIVPEVEKLDLAALKAKAAPLGEDMVRLVEKDGVWNPVAKGTIVTTAPAVVAQLLNSVGVSAAHAPTIALVGAIGAIFTGRQILVAKLEELAKAHPKTSAP